MALTRAGLPALEPLDPIAPASCRPVFAVGCAAPSMIRAQIQSAAKPRRAAPKDPAQRCRGTARVHGLQRAQAPHGRAGAGRA